MSCAWPHFQVNLQGVFDHAGDLNDHLVIERREKVFKHRRGQKRSPRWLQEDGKNGENRRWGGGMKDRVKNEVTA